MDNIAGLYRTFKLEENETALSQAKKQLKNITDFIQNFNVNLVLGDFNLDFEKRKGNNYQHRRIYDEWLEATAFDFIQLIKEPTWERIYDRVRTSTIDLI